jgi:hypothetical protein
VAAAVNSSFRINHKVYDKQQVSSNNEEAADLKGNKRSGAKGYYLLSANYMYTLPVQITDYRS